MTRKDYELLARALNNAAPEHNHDFSKSDCSEAHTAWLAACCSVSDALLKDNPRFDPDRFLTRCGMEHGEVMPYRTQEDA